MISLISIKQKLCHWSIFENLPKTRRKIEVKRPVRGAFAMDKNRQNGKIFTALAKNERELSFHAFEPGAELPSVCPLTCAKE